MPHVFSLETGPSGQIAIYLTLKLNIRLKVADHCGTEAGRATGEPRNMPTEDLGGNEAAEFTLSEPPVGSLRSRVDSGPGAAEACAPPVGEQTKFRAELHERFVSRLSIDPNLSRTVVSYQGNRNAPGFRWMKYKEGFSRQLVERFLNQHNPNSVLDPFAGIGTTPLTATWNQSSGTGIEIMPIGVRIGKGIAAAANDISLDNLRQTGDKLLQRISSGKNVSDTFSFPHVNITRSAFSKETENEITRAREFLANVEDSSIKLLLDLACMAVLEASSYTRKDGQYLRWDYRSGRPLRSKVDKGQIIPFRFALDAKLNEIYQDIELLKQTKQNFIPNLICGSSLEELKRLPSEEYELVITSPPYANRYDYTRTYALELAWLGYSQEEFSNLRQSMLTATVENRCKHDWLNNVYSGENTILQKATNISSNQMALAEVLSILNQNVRELSNKHVIRLLEGYFFEMAIIIAELARVLKPGGQVIMINDNVQYHGEEVPVDFILSDFAEQCGLACKQIWMLPRGKGNSSQQMAKFGRREIRKCVYHWKKEND